MRRVAVTGLGAVCALGLGVPAMWAAILAGRSGIGPISGIPTERIATPIAAQVPDFNPLDHFEPRRVPLMDRATQFALVAGREAMGHAGLTLDPAHARRHGAVLGAAIGQTSLDEAYRVFYGEGASRVHPLTVPRLMPSAAASHLSMEFGLRGPSYAVASACASANHAIAQAADLIRMGRADVVLTGGADASIVVGVLKCWEGLRVLSPEGCRPFSRDRTGLVLGEGAAVLVLEAWDHAVRRGACVHAELAGSGMGADAMDLTAPDAAGCAAAIQAALDDAGLDAAAIGYVNAHGTGTRLNDRTESVALRRVFGSRVPPVSSCKGAIGHCLSAAGALEAVATVLALRDGVLPPTAGFRDADPDCDVDPVPEARHVQVGAALSSSFAFGGLNAVLAFRRA